MKTCSATALSLFVAITVAFAFTSKVVATSTTLVQCNKECKRGAHKLFAKCVPTSDPFVLDENGVGYTRRNLREADQEHRDLQGCSVCEVPNPPPICCVIPWCSYTCGGCGTCGGRRKLSEQDIAKDCEKMFDSFCNYGKKDIWEKGGKDDDEDDVTCTVTVFDNLSPEEIAEIASDSGL